MKHFYRQSTHAHTTHIHMQTHTHTHTPTHRHVHLYTHKSFDVKKKEKKREKQETGALNSPQMTLRELSFYSSHDTTFVLDVINYKFLLKINTASNWLINISLFE